MQRIWLSQNFRSHIRSQVLIKLLTLQSSNKIIVFPYRGHRQGRPREDTNTEHLLKCYEPGPSRDAQRKHTSYVFVRKFCPGWYDSATPRERVRGFQGLSYMSFGRFTQTWRHHYMCSIHLKNWKQWWRINNWGEIAFFWEELSSHLITQFNQLYIIDLKTGAGDKRRYLLSPTYFRMWGHAPWPLFSHYWLEGIECQCTPIEPCVCLFISICLYSNVIIHHLSSIVQTQDNQMHIFSLAGYMGALGSFLIGCEADSKDGAAN